MYKLNQDTKELTAVKESTFAKLGFKERPDLQEWIANNSNILGEELLVIQKEFAGFNDTKERLDLLALDKNKNLVIIENKLDDSGKDVVWQASKYAAYCSTLTTDGIKQIYQEYLNKNNIGISAEEKLKEFYNETDIDELQLNQKNTERIILVARSFRKEVTSTILWMRSYSIDIKCIKIIPYQHGDLVFIDVEQIIPVKEVEEYMIGLEVKNDSDTKNSKQREKTLQQRKEFWGIVIEEMNMRSHLCKNLSPQEKNTLNCSTGIRGIQYTFVETSTYTAVELAIKTDDVQYNKHIFDLIVEKKDEIESKLRDSLVWDRGEVKKESRISWQFEGVDLNNYEDRQVVAENMCKKMICFNDVMMPYIKQITTKK